MSDIPSEISLDNAVVAQDEMGRPFIIVREYVSPEIVMLTFFFSVKDERNGSTAQMR